MITQQMVSEKLLAYLDNQLSFNQIVTWTEQVMAQGNFTPDSNIELLVGIVMSLAGAERPRSVVRQDFMNQPTVPSKSIRVDAA